MDPLPPPSPKPSHGGESAGALGSFEAITALMSLFNQEGEGLLTLGPEGRLEGLNGPGASLLGLATAEQAPRVEVLSFVHPEDRDLFQAHLQRALGGFATQLGFRLLDAKGTLRFIEASLLQIPNPAHAPFLLARFRDATDETRSKRALLEQAALHQAILDSTPLHLAVVDSEGRILSVNGPWRRAQGDLAPWRGKVRQNLLQRLREAPETDQAEAIRRAIEGVLEGTLRQHTQECILHPQGGSPRHFVLHVQPVAGGFAGAVVTWLDVTEERQREAHLLASQRLESLGLLASTIAHDLKNLLSAAQLQLDLATLDLREPARLGAHIERTVGVLEQMTQFAHRLMAFAGEETGHFRALDLSEVVLEMREILALATGGLYQIQFEAEPGLPRIVGDPVQIRQGLLNLVTNARDAMAQGRGEVRIRTGLREVRVPGLPVQLPPGTLPLGTYVTLESRDTGCGIPADVLRRMFEPFYSTKGAGRGLGLSTLQALVQSHGAFLQVESEVGVGTAFRLCFPLQEAP